MGIFTTILLQPIFNVLVFLYNTVAFHDLGVAIIALTLLLKIIFYPLNRRAIVSQKALQKIQPKIEELKEKHKDDREKLGAEMMALYKREKINPFSSCLPLIVQLPILFAVYQVFIRGLNGESLDLLYPWVTNPGALNTLSLGFLELSKRSIPLAVLAGAAQFWQTKMLMNRRDQKGSIPSAMNKQMLYLMPIMTVWIGSFFPAGLALYWFATTVFSALQQLWMIRKKEISG